jgi:hypothetical protein
MKLTKIWKILYPLLPLYLSVSFLLCLWALMHISFWEAEIYFFLDTFPFFLRLHQMLSLINLFYCFLLNFLFQERFNRVSKYFSNQTNKRKNINSITINPITQIPLAKDGSKIIKNRMKRKDRGSVRGVVTAGKTRHTIYFPFIGIFSSKVVYIDPRERECITGEGRGSNGFVSFWLWLLVSKKDGLMKVVYAQGESLLSLHRLPSSKSLLLERE